MQISAKMPAAEAINQQERERVREDGPDEGFFYITMYIPSELERQDRFGDTDYAETCVEAVRMLAAKDSRIARGRFSGISIH